jgi:hypothetical protein
MKYCNKCGKELFDEAVICPGCGCQVGVIVKTVDENAGRPSGWWAGFFFGWIGVIILGLTNIGKEDHLKRSIGGAIAWSIIYTVIGIVIATLGHALLSYLTSFFII